MAAIMTVREAAEHLGVSPETVYRLIQQDGLRAFRLGAGSGGRWRIDRADLDDYVERKKALEEKADPWVRTRPRPDPWGRSPRSAAYHRNRQARGLE